jgi:ABC-type sulfate transport system permease component
MIALLFVTSVRRRSIAAHCCSESSTEVEQAAASLGRQSRHRCAEDWLLPALQPAIPVRARRPSARSIGEIGSVYLIAGKVRIPRASSSSLTHPESS